ncbi:conserved hypothetical protein, partial [Trichinella spiralis]|uniref:hypothetical protein n=1 Tax=Trichinella spiralis TaxID=6334 RepID=UPI0001EFD450
MRSRNIIRTYLLGRRPKEPPPKNHHFTIGAFVLLSVEAGNFIPPIGAPGSSGWLFEYDNCSLRLRLAASLQNIYLFILTLVLCKKSRMKMSPIPLNWLLISNRYDYCRRLASSSLSTSGIKSSVFELFGESDDYVL